FLGGGVALLVAALSRTDLDLHGLAGASGLWFLTALGAGLVFAAVNIVRNRSERSVRWLDIGLPAALGVLAVGLRLGLPIQNMHRGLAELLTRLHESLPSRLPVRLANLLDLSSTGVLIVFIFVLPVVLCYLFVKRPLRFGLGVGALFLANSVCDILDEDLLLRQRTFFGVLQVTDRGNFRRLEHGTTLHGQQRTHWSRATVAAGSAACLGTSNPLGAAVLFAAEQDTLMHPGREPLTYFHRTGPIGQIFTAYQSQLAGRHVGLIGLGSGTLASYGQKGQTLTYYEI